MRRIVIISDQPDKFSCFDTVERSKSVEVEYHGVKSWRSLLNERGITLYLDLSALSEREARRAVRTLESQDSVSYGIIDPGGRVPDPADLFHGGASDYIGPGLISRRIPTNRIIQAVSFYPSEESEQNSEEESDLSWADIHDGGEYPFFFLYVELDIPPEWKTESGSGMISGLLHTFESHLSRIMGPLGGELWMKSDYGGLYLFPYSEGVSDIIPACMRLVLNKVLISTEVYSYGTLLPYHFALDKGVTVYRKKGRTGTLISDTVNFIFHLGQQHAAPGNFIMSKRVAEHIPPGLASCFVEHGEYHDQPLLRMKLPK